MSNSANVNFADIFVTFVAATFFMLHSPTAERSAGKSNYNFFSFFPLHSLEIKVSLTHNEEI